MIEDGREMAQLQDVPGISRYRMLGHLANRISGYPGLQVTMNYVKGTWLKVAYGHRSILVSAEHCGKDGWCYRWGNHRDRRRPVGEVTSVAHQIATLLMNRSRP